MGGAMTVANPYIAQARLQSIKRYLPVSPNRPKDDDIPEYCFTDKSVFYGSEMRLSEDRNEAMRMMSDIENITANLPGIDCGSCGAPTCLAFAEDVVKKETEIDECTVIMRELFHQCLSMRQANELTKKFIANKKAHINKEDEDDET